MGMERITQELMTRPRVLAAKLNGRLAWIAPWPTFGGRPVSVSFVLRVYAVRLICRREVCIAYRDHCLGLDTVSRIVCGRRKSVCDDVRGGDGGIGKEVGGGGP